MTMSVSQQEKEQLRKRLRKLFQKEENLKRSSTNSTSNQQPKDQKSKGDFDYSTNKKKQQCEKKMPKIVPMQNGFTNAAGKQSSENKKPGKYKDQKKNIPKLQKKPNASAVRLNEEVPPKKQSQSKAKNPSTQNQSKGEKIPKRPTVNKKIDKNQGRLENPEIKITEKKKSTKFKPAIKKLNATANNSSNINKNQSKNAKKRAAVSSIIESSTVTNKKRKLIKKNVQKDAKASKKQITISDESNSASSQHENEYDVNHMTGCVPSGAFNSDSDRSYKKFRYCMKAENYSENDSEEDSNEEYSESDLEEDTVTQNEIFFGSDDSSTKTSETNTTMSRFKERPNTDLKQFYQNYYSDGEEGNFDSDSEFETEYSECDSFGEEYDNYSDYDEDDYEEEEDSYDYTSESENEYPMDYDFDHDDNDEDYELPKHISEDLIIHKGTSSKRDLKPEDNVSFDSDNGDLQIVELEKQQTIKITQQPKAYDKEELVKLKFEEKTSSSITFQKKESIQIDNEDCPKLVPIVDEDGFQLYNPNEKSDDEEMGEEEDELEDEEEELEDEEGEMEDEQEPENYEEESIEEFDDESMDDVSLGSEYTEIGSDDADSLLSEDINEKYLKRKNDASDSDDNIQENVWLKKHKPDVIDATAYKCENIFQNSSDHSEAILNDDIMQIPSVNLYKNVDLKTECSILSTTIIDNKMQFTNDNFDQSLDVKSIETQDAGDISTIKEAELNDHKNTTEESPKAAKPFMQRITKYKTKFFNAFNSNLVIVLLRDPFYIYGTVRLTLLAGSMEVYGHSLKLNTEVEIFSPRGCSVIEISALPTKNNISKNNLTELLKSYEQQFGLNDLKRIASLYNAERDAVILLKRNDERKKVVQQYKKFMNENVFPNIKNINADRPFYNSEYLLRCMINTSSQEQKCLHIPKDWQEFKLTPKSRVMLVGGKSVGKSTLLRYLINRQLPEKVLLIDLDIGQPEVFIPQTVSCTIIEQPLLGPGFLLNLQPEISFAIGHTNIALCAHKYLSAVRSLLAYCREQEAFKDIPWLLNTMGYNKGFGLELISVLAQEALTDVIQLQSSKEINNFESTLQAHVLSNVPHILFSEEYERIKEEVKVNWNYRLHVWPSAVQQESRYQKEWEMGAKDLRFAMLLARLSQALQGHADWLTDVKPLSASLNDLKIINLMDNTPLVSAEELEKVLEANLVYLCHYEEELKPLKCLGIGVVRAIDFHVRHLYLIPALPYTQLKYVNCLAIGEMPLPTSLFTNQGPRIKNIAPFVYNTVAASASKAIKQIYHRPAKFLTGKHNSLE